MKKNKKLYQMKIYEYTFTQKSDVIFKILLPKLTHCSYMNGFQLYIIKNVKFDCYATDKYKSKSKSEILINRSNITNNHRFLYNYLYNEQYYDSLTMDEKDFIIKYKKPFKTYQEYKESFIMPEPSQSGEIELYIPIFNNYFNPWMDGYSKIHCTVEIDDDISNILINNSNSNNSNNDLKITIEEFAIINE